MTTPEERDLRAELIQAKARRRGIRVYELLAVSLALGLLLTAYFVGGDAPAATRQLFIYIAGACFIGAAFYNLYGNVLVRPHVEHLQRQVNKHGG